MFGDLHIYEHIPLADLTVFKIGGNARFFVDAKSEKSIVKALSHADKRGLEVFVLGGGSNILIADEGFRGMVLKMSIKGIFETEEKNGNVYVTAMAGENWDEFVAYCVSRNLAGIECLSGIPGLVGGVPIQNVGAYGQEASETIAFVKVYDRRLKKVIRLVNAECGFEYRKSIFNTTEKERYIVLSVTYALKRNKDAKIVYKDLKELFSDKNPTLNETRKAVCKIRESKGMLAKQGGLNAQSAGSFFKNPILTREKFEKIKKASIRKGQENIPSYAVGENFIKIPAAWLIEKTGFHKGYIHGNVGLSTQHTLALVNRGNATAKEILELKRKIQENVKEAFKIELIPEPNFVGFKK